MTTMDSKSLMRARLRTARNALSAGRRKASNANIVAILSSEVRAAPRVGAYFALGGEADPLPCRSGWRAQGFVLPRVARDGRLTFHEVDNEDELVVGYRGIMEPCEQAVEVPLSSLHTILVPGLGFDRLGMRLGQGGGFYDRLLAHEDCPFSIGIAFSTQIVPSIPRAAHDRSVDIVVTERGIARNGAWHRSSRQWRAVGGAAERSVVV